MKIQNRKGITALEVMIATVLLGLGIVPIVSMTVGTSREAGFSEAHVLVQNRATSLLDCVEAAGHEALPTADEGALTVPATASAAPALPAGPIGNGYSEKISYERLENDLVAVTVTISWLMATDGAARFGKPHTFRAFRIVSRPDASWSHKIELPITPVGTPLAAD